MGQYRFLTAGESHGRALAVIVEGMVAGLPLRATQIDHELRRRQKGYGRGDRMGIEEDRVEILSGVRHGRTIGSPIALTIRNRDWENWQREMAVEPVDGETVAITRPRPAHADLAGFAKYNLKDIRPIIERASARETAARVAVGAVGRRFLEEFGVVIHSRTIAIGDVTGDSEGDWLCGLGMGEAGRIDWDVVEGSPVRCADREVEGAMVSAIDAAKSRGDTLGGIFEVVATGVPVGIGSHVHWDKRLDGRIAQAIMSINAVKGVEIGLGFGLASLPGSEAHDAIEPRAGRGGGEERGASDRGSEPGLPWRRPSNRAGGIEGGISNGEPIVVRVGIKPIATLGDALPSVDLATGEGAKGRYERSDVCVVPAAGVIGEAMLAIVLADACLEKFGGDSLTESLRNRDSYLSGVAGD